MQNPESELVLRFPPGRETPSQLGRIAACPSSEALPHAARMSYPARRGTIGHRYLCNCNVLKNKWDALALEREEDRDWLDALPTDRLPIDPNTYAPEVAFAWDPETDTARELGRNIEREEAARRARPGELVGIADVAGVSAAAAHIHDFKLGYGWVEAAESNWQVKTYALMAARAWKKDAAEVFIQRAFPDRDPWTDSYSMDYFALEEHAEAVRSLLRKRKAVLELAARGAPLPPFVEGPHCTYCPAIWSCPVKMTALHALAKDPAEQGGTSGLDVRVREMRVEDAGLAYFLLDKMKSRLEYYLGTIELASMTTPIPLPDGRILGVCEKSQESINPAKAKDGLVRLYGEELGTLLFTQSLEEKKAITKENLKRNLRKYVLPKMPKKEAKIGAVEAKTLDALRRTGGMSTKTRTGPAPHWPEAPKELAEGAAERPAELEEAPKEEDNMATGDAPPEPLETPAIPEESTPPPGTKRRGAGSGVSW